MEMSRSVQCGTMVKPIGPTKFPTVGMHSLWVKFSMLMLHLAPAPRDSNLMDVQWNLDLGILKTLCRWCLYAAKVKLWI